MIVGDDLSVMPITDRLLHHVAGSYETEIVQGDIAWSNELALHVVELKTNEPAEVLRGLAGRFQDHVGQINGLLRNWQARLMPTAMHPWMDPHRELMLWPHDYNEVYEAFHRVFNCQGHGWANLQSMHLNLPFSDDEQFGRLHAAIRILLPLLPGLAASSPIADSQRTGHLDSRLSYYRNNAARLPLVTGQVVPEPVFTAADYRQRILEPMYRQIAPFDQAGTLQHEWLNARGAIARFQRNSIEIRVLDVQECPAADLAIAQLVIAALRGMASERWSSLAKQQATPTEPLAGLLNATVRDADQTIVRNPDYLALWGLKSITAISVQELWQRIADETNVAEQMEPACAQALDVLLRQGTLARRILRRLEGERFNSTQPDARQTLQQVYGELCMCLSQGTMFHA
jgi:gamma-glutamyl:cysteine ligase YbdK (ATP-grasp superfamily)